MISKEMAREFTLNAIIDECNNIVENYMAIYDEYYETSSRDSAFLKDLVDSLQGISAVLEVYVRDKKIHSNYAVEKLNFSKSYIESCIRYFKNKEDYTGDES